MRTSLLGMSLIGLMATSTFAQAQSYSHQHRYTEADEGRRFNDGTRVRCRNVEVQKKTRLTRTASAVRWPALQLVAC